jgi:hypothetical protein
VVGRAQIAVLAGLALGLPACSEPQAVRDRSAGDTDAGVRAGAVTAADAPLNPSSANPLSFARPSLANTEMEAATFHHVEGWPEPVRLPALARPGECKEGEPYHVDYGVQCPF